MEIPIGTHGYAGNFGIHLDSMIGVPGTLVGPIPWRQGICGI